MKTIEVNLIPISEQTAIAIRSGISLEGFGQYNTDAVKIRERTDIRSGHKVFRLSLEFTQEAVMDEATEAYSNIDQLVYLGRRFAKEFQLKMSHLMPCCRIGNKVIMSVKEYETLRGSTYMFISITTTRRYINISSIYLLTHSISLIPPACYALKPIGSTLLIFHSLPPAC